MNRPTPSGATSGTVATSRGSTRRNGTPSFCSVAVQAATVVSVADPTTRNRASTGFPSAAAQAAGTAPVRKKSTPATMAAYSRAPAGPHNQGGRTSRTILGPSGDASLRRMERLWAPWRLEYVQHADEDDGCVFCRAAAGDDVEYLVVHRGERAFVLLNKFPYASGHFMVAPYRHGAQFSDLDDAEALETHRLAVQGIEALAAVYRPEGHNVGWNLGRIAGRGDRRPRSSPRRAALERRHELHAGPRGRARPARASARDAAAPGRRVAGLTSLRVSTVTCGDHRPSRAHAPTASSRNRGSPVRRSPLPGSIRAFPTGFIPSTPGTATGAASQCARGHDPHRRLRRAHTPRRGRPRRGAGPPGGLRARIAAASTS